MRRSRPSGDAFSTGQRQGSCHWILKILEERVLQHEMLCDSSSQLQYDSVRSCAGYPAEAGSHHLPASTLQRPIEADTGDRTVQNGSE